MADTLRPLRTICVATGLTPESTGGCMVAKRLSERFEATLHAVHVAEPISADEEAAIPGRTEKHIDFATAELATFLEARGLAPPVATPHVLHGNTADQILQFVADNNIDLLVLGRYGKGGLKRGVIGSIAAALMRKCPVSVCLVSPEHSGAHNHIAVATALIEESHIPIARAIDLAHRKGFKSIDLIHVFRVPQGYHMVCSWDDAVAKLTRTYTDKAHAAIDHARQTASPDASADVEVNLIVEEGAPATKLAEIVEREGIDMLIGAPHTRTHAAKLFLPPVAESIINRLNCTTWAEKTPAKTETMLDALKKLLS